jgi:hypothetical protein
MVWQTHPQCSSHCSQNYLPRNFGLQTYGPILSNWFSQQSCPSLHQSPTTPSSLHPLLSTYGTPLFNCPSCCCCWMSTHQCHYMTYIYLSTSPACNCLFTRLSTFSLRGEMLCLVRLACLLTLKHSRSGSRSRSLKDQYTSIAINSLRLTSYTYSSYLHHQPSKVSLTSSSLS